jgi:SSS family solute:Na+ symporter
VPTLASVDWLILLLYLFFALTIGSSLKPFMAGDKEFFGAGRALPAWLCGIAFLTASLGSQEVIGMGAAGAKYGLASVAFYTLGAIPAMLFMGLFMMPLYYGSKARSVPEFLGLRFDGKTRTLCACLYAVVLVFGAGISLYAMARLAEGLHAFDSMYDSLHLPPTGGVILSMALPAAIVLACLLLGGLTGTIYNLVLQLSVVAAGLLPLVLLGLKQIGGWSGLKAIAPTVMYLHEWKGGVHPNGLGELALAAGLGIVLGAGYWCTDFRVLQTAMAAKNMESARRAPLIAAALKLFLPLLLIVPGLIAVTLPTPHTTTVVRNADGAIYHDITVVPEATEQGRGLVPAQTDSAADPVMGKPLLDANGHALLNYDLATPEALLHYLPSGLLGLGLTALLACLMGGVAVSIMAFTTIFTCDLYQPHFGRPDANNGASDKHLMAVGRWAALGGTVLAVGAGCAALPLHGVLDALALVFALVNAPLLATLLLGMFWKRTTGHGAFAGLIAGIAAAVLHQGLTLPLDVQRGLHGGWLAVLHQYPGALAQSFWTAVFAIGANLAVTVAVSLCTPARPETELVGLVHSLTPRPKPASSKSAGPKSAGSPWWKRPEGLAAIILCAAILVSLIFA